MTSLAELMQYIVNTPGHPDFVAVKTGAWESLRDECRYMCEESDEPFSCDAKFYAPNFLVLGVRIIAAGTA